MKYAIRIIAGLLLSLSVILATTGSAEAAGKTKYTAWTQVKQVYVGQDDCTQFRGNHGADGGNHITRCAGKGIGKGALTYNGQSAALVAPGCKVETSGRTARYIGRHDTTGVNRRAVRVWMDVNLWKYTNAYIFCGYGHD